MSSVVSIITASYNKAKLIGDTIKSVLNQDYPFWELLIIDDASTDDSQQQIKRYSEKDSRIKTHFLPENKGANHCRNLGIKNANGRYLIFLDADDLLESKCLSTRVGIMNTQPDLDFSVQSMQVFKKTIGDYNFKWIPKTETPLADFLSHKLPWQTMQPIWKTEFISNLKGFDEEFQRLQDVELHTRALLTENVKFLLSPNICDSFYRIDEERKNFNAFDFLERWINSAIQYCDKFKNISQIDAEKFLMGTLFHAYLQLLINYKMKKIRKTEFNLLENKLLNYTLIITTSRLRKTIFYFSKIYNLHFIRIPGVNKLLSSILILE